jgi:hypothetical protein
MARSTRDTASRSRTRSAQHGCGTGSPGFIEAESDQLISAIEPAGGGELRREFAGPLAVAVVTDALGLRDIHADTVLSRYDAIAAIFPVRRPRVRAACPSAARRLRTQFTTPYAAIK